MSGYALSTYSLLLILQPNLFVLLLFRAFSVVIFTAYICRLADVIKSGEGLNEKHSAPENIHSLISELKMYQLNVPELWESRNKQLSQCKDALVCRHSYEKLDTDIHKLN